MSPKKKWASAHFVHFKNLLINKEKLRFFQDYTFLKIWVLSVFSQENSPLFVGFLPKWP